MKPYLSAKIRELIPTYCEFLARLIRFESVYGNERLAQLYVKEKMNQIGLVVNEYYSREDKESLNLVARIKGRKSNLYQSLILNAHCDVAPVDCPEKWERSPFAGEIVDNKIYGRGSQDDKAGIAIILLLAELLTQSKIELNGDLIVEIVIEDETTGNGSKTLIDNGYTADGVIIVDGTWSERIIYAHLGQIWIDVKITGIPAAACVESRGINPIYIATEFIQRIKNEISRLNQVAEPFEGIDMPYIVNVGSIRSGAWPGSVPACAEVGIQISFPDYHSPDDMLGLIQNIARDVSERIEIRQGLLKTPAFKTDPNSRLISKLKNIIAGNSGKEVLTVPVTGHCDMRHFPTSNICLYGTGAGKNAHAIDEYYELDQQEIVAGNLLDFILEWCNERK